MNSRVASCSNSPLSHTSADELPASVDNPVNSPILSPLNNSRCIFLINQRLSYLSPENNSRPSADELPANWRKNRCSAAPMLAFGPFEGADPVSLSCMNYNLVVVARASVNIVCHDRNKECSPLRGETEKRLPPLPPYPRAFSPRAMRSPTQ